MPLPSLFLAEIIGVLYIAKSRLPFRSFVSRRRCTIVPQSYFHYQNCVQLTFRYCFKNIIHTAHIGVLVHSLVLIYAIYGAMYGKRAGKVRLSLGKCPKILGFVPCEYVTHTKYI